MRIWISRCWKLRYSHYRRSHIVNAYCNAKERKRPTKVIRCKGSKFVRLLAICKGMLTMLRTKCIKLSVQVSLIWCLKRVEYLESKTSMRRIYPFVLNLKKIIILRLYSWWWTPSWFDVKRSRQHFKYE